MAGAVPEAAFGLMEDFPFPNWAQGECLGAGNFGKVYKCYTFKAIMAVKKVKMEPQYTETQEEVKALTNEIHILKKLKHERIVSYYGSEQKDSFLHLFMDFMAGGSLSDYIKKNGILCEKLSKRYTKQMLEGVYFLHSQDIIHRDIKGSNVLLNERGNVKLADFGLSKMIQKVGSKTNLVTHCGTPYWMAPEIFWGNGYGRKIDIWSLGCTVVEMLTGKPPLRHLEPAAAIFRIGSKPLELKLPESVSHDAKDFINAALTWKPEERPWSDELQRHKFFSKAQSFTWRLGKLIGEGTNGKVYKCSLKRYGDQGPPQVFAVKIFTMELQDTEKLKALLNEITELKKVKHERIVSVYQCEQEGGHLHILMEFMSGGSLYNHIKSRDNGVLSEQESSLYTKQMLEGVTFLHSRNIIHRGIRGSNVLLDGKGNVKLAVCGLKNMIQKCEGFNYRLDIAYWMAPESFLGLRYGLKADIWSLGCTVVEMLTGNPPLSHFKPERAALKIVSETFDIVSTLSLNVSYDAKGFITAALTWNADQRPSSPDLERHAFVTNRRTLDQVQTKEQLLSHKKKKTVN